jgi:hypothetical protein
MLDPLSNLTARPVRSVLHILQEGVQTLFHLLLFSLLVLGFGGLLYKALRSGGWIEGVLGRIWDQHPTMAIVTLLAALAAAMWGTACSIVCRCSASVATCWFTAAWL